MVRVWMVRHIVQLKMFSFDLLGLDRDLAAIKPSIALRGYPAVMTSSLRTGTSPLE
jgi:hypothetical protein